MTELHHFQTFASSSLISKNVCLLAKTFQKPSPDAYEEEKLQEIIIFAFSLESVLMISGYLGLPWRHFLVIWTNLGDLHQFLWLGFISQFANVHLRASVLYFLLCIAILNIMKHSHCHWVGMRVGDGWLQMHVSIYELAIDGQFALHTSRI